MLELYNAKGEHIGALAQVVNQHCCRTLSDGDETLDFEVPRGSTHETAIETEGYVRTRRQEYVVKKTDRTTSNTMTKVEASLNIESLEGTPFVGGFVTIEKTLAECMEAALADTGWRCSVEDGIEKRRTVRIEQDTTVWEIVKDAISTYRVEVRIETLEKCLYFVERRGGKKGAYFYERINLRSLGVTASSYGFYTKLIPLGKDGLGLWVDGKNYIENYQHSTKQITEVWRDDRYTNTTSLYEDALARLEEASRPVMAFTGELVNLAKQSKKYSVLDYDLGDTVLLASSTVGVWVMQRIVQLDEYEQHPEENTAEFSNVQETFAQLQKKGDELAKKEAIEAANRTMTATLKDGYFTKTETTTAIAAMEEKILLEVGSSEEQWEEYMDGRLASYPTKTEMRSAIELTTQEIELSVSSKITENAATKEELAARFQVLADEISMSFTSAKTEIEGVDSDMENRFEQLRKYIKFSGETALTLGTGEGAVTLELDPADGIIFSKNGVPFGYWDGVDFHTGNIIIEVNEKAQLGIFAYIPRSDGSLMFLKVSGNDTGAEDDEYEEFVPTPGSGGGADPEFEYTIENVAGAAYGFTLNAAGYYESGNKGQDNTAALAKVVMTAPSQTTIEFSFINYAEQGFDYGIFGAIDEELGTTYTTDDAGKCALICNTASNNAQTVQTLRYTVPAGDHFIVVKFRKDSSQSTYNDSLQFKIEVV